MSIKSTASCMNCENFNSDFVCEKHNIEVSLLNVCDSHQLSNESVSKNSNCSNCNHFEKSSCAHPSSASEGVLCFSWQSN